MFALTFPVALVVSLVGVLETLIAVAVLVLLIVGLKWLFEKLGFTLPPAMWAVLGFILVCALLIVALTSGVTVTK